MVPKDYNHNQVPVRNGTPAMVKLRVRPWTIGEISLQHMTFFVNLYITTWWVDYRLNIPNDSNTTLVLPDDVASKLWTPHVSFRNCIACEAMQFKHEEHELFLQGDELMFRARLDAKLFCNFRVANYPMDSHYCSIEVQSTHTLLIALLLIPDIPDHSFVRNASLPQFTVEDLSSGYCSNDLDTSGNFLSCVEYKMKFIRNMTYHVMLIYCPCILIVLLSWISFWLDIDLVAPRVALGLTSLLTLSTQFSNAQKNLPPVSYLKAIDIWFIFCMFMVFASLVEFAICYVLWKIERKKNSRSNSICHIEPLQLPAPKTPKPKLDSWARIAFPFAFVLFNICYWSYYGTRE